MSVSTASSEKETRFAFGKNWQQFLNVLNDERIELARNSVKSLLQVDSLEGKRLLDIGSGSGLFSLASRRLGADVTSFDFDLVRVACTGELRQRLFKDDQQWNVQQGSVLDKPFLESLGQFDVVYSWGVLHHTGDMRQAFENVVPLVAPGGQLAISIYNDQGSWSRRWTLIKRCYNSLPDFLKPMFLLLIIVPRELKYLLLDTLRLKPWAYFRNIRDYSKHSMRGMSYWHDLKDWVGGYPFEVAKPEQVFEYFTQRGFTMTKMTTVAGGSGCNEFAFRADP